MNSSSEASEAVSTSHVGYLCDARKIAVVRNPQSRTFVVQNMAIFESAPLTASRSVFKEIYSGSIEQVETPLGLFGLCDFSRILAPGVYRVVLSESGVHSYQFAIADGIYHRLPYLFLDYVHEQRSGYFSTDLHRPLNVDDGIRSDNGQVWDTSGGWYDAGDLRKWMAHSTLPALAFLETFERMRLNRHAFESTYSVDWLTETSWGLAFIFKMQDPANGMIYEDVGGGSIARFRPGMSWWYENHAGCYADNADNRFTDNLLNSGDERSIRVQYNPIAQYTNVAILARSYAVYSTYDAQLAFHCHTAAEAVWAFCATRLNDEEHGWTAVRAWRLCAALELFRAGLLPVAAVDTALEALLANFSDDLGFWLNGVNSNEPYHGIIHAAQPLIALARYLEFIPDSAHVERIRGVLKQSKTRFIDPLSQTNPFRFMPFGVYSQPATQNDLYHPWRERWVMRFVMPVHHPQQINHGLGGHWMSWAHALAYVGKVLGETSPAGDWSALAWAQIDWLLGNNLQDVSFISGVGFNNPMPHSRYLGTLIGGFMNGFRGTEVDVPAVDLNREAEWNSTEYWNVPLSNCLMALGLLLPATVLANRKLG